MPKVENQKGLPSSDKRHLKRPYPWSPNAQAREIIGIIILWTCQKTMGKTQLKVKTSPSRKKGRELPRERKKEILKGKGLLKPRIDEESLFNHFTADIIKLKTKFTR